MGLESEAIECPYCGETIEVLLDLSGGDQDYIEDCSVCCKPMRLKLQVDGNEWMLDVFGEND